MVTNSNFRLSARRSKRSNSDYTTFMGLYYSNFRQAQTPIKTMSLILVDWLVCCLGFKRPFETVFQSISSRLPKRGTKRRERIEESINVQTTPTRTYCKRSRPLPYCFQIVGRPGTGSLPSTIAPPDHP